METRNKPRFAFSFDSRIHDEMKIDSKLEEGVAMTKVLNSMRHDMAWRQGQASSLGSKYLDHI